MLQTLIDLDVLCWTMMIAGSAMMGTALRQRR
jgi:hypothetical protein